MTTEVPNPPASPGVATDAPLVAGRPSLRRELFHATLASGTYAAADGFVRAVSLVLTVFYTRYLTPQDYGTLAITSTVVLLLVPVLGLSVTNAISRLWFEASTDTDRRRLIGTVLVFLLVVPSAIVAVIEVLGQLHALDAFAAAPYDPYLRYAILTAYCTLFVDVPVSVYIVRREPRKVLLLTVVNATITLGLSLTLVVGLHEGVTGVLRANLFAAAAMAGLAIVLAARMSWHELSVSSRILRIALAFTAPLIPSALSQWVLQVSDRPLLSHYLSADKVGQYYIGYSVGAIAGLLIHGASRAVNPIVTRDLKADFNERVVRIGTYWFVGLVFACLVVALFGRDVLGLVTRGHFPAAPRVVPVIALAHIAFAAYVVVTQGIWFGMRTRWVPLLTAIAGATSVGLNILLIPRYGLMAAAWDTVAGFGVLAVLHAILAHRIYRIDWEYVRWAKAVVAVIAAYFVAGIAGSNASVERLGAEALALCIVFPLALTLLRFWTPTERRLLLGRWKALRRA
jgi:O-antigen/teichoic acid export membrane protein